MSNPKESFGFKKWFEEMRKNDMFVIEYEGAVEIWRWGYSEKEKDVKARDAKLLGDFEEMKDIMAGFKDCLAVEEMNKLIAKWLLLLLEGGKK